MKIFMFFILAVTFLGCATIPQGTTPSVSPLISEDGTAKKYEVLGKSEGSAGHFTLFGFIPFGRTDIDAAIREAIDPYQGDNLINVSYYVNSAFYFIGNSTSITVEGDVIKYTDKETIADTKKNIINTPVKTGRNSNHKISIGSAVDGFAVDYTLTKPLNDFLYLSFSAGYKSGEKEESASIYSYYGSTYRINYKYEYSAIPVMVNVGGYFKKFLDIPLNPYVSIGAAYIPIQTDGSYSSSDFNWEQAGINFNIGADYEFAKGFAVGLDYRYINSFTELNNSNYYSNEDKKLGFSNLNLSLIFYP